MKRYSLYLLVGASMVLYGIAAFGYQPATAPNAAGQLTSRYCVSCHNQRLKSGNLALDTLNTTNIASSAERWEKVIVKLRSRSMPPPRRLACPLAGGITTPRPTPIGSGEHSE